MSSARIRSDLKLAAGKRAPILRHSLANRLIVALYVGYLVGFRFSPTSNAELEARLEFGDAGELPLWGERPNQTTDDIFGWVPEAPEGEDQ